MRFFRKYCKRRILTGALLTSVSLIGIQGGVDIYRNNLTQELLTSKIETQSLLEANQKLEKAILDKRNSDSNGSICLPVYCELNESTEIVDQISTFRRKLQIIETFRPEIKPLIQKLESAKFIFFLYIVIRKNCLTACTYMILQTHITRDLFIINLKIAYSF